MAGRAERWGSRPGGEQTVHYRGASRARFTRGRAFSLKNEMCKTNRAVAERSAGVSTGGAGVLAVTYRPVTYAFACLCQRHLFAGESAVRRQCEGKKHVHWKHEANPKVAARGRGPSSRGIGNHVTTATPTSERGDSATKITLWGRVTRAICQSAGKKGRRRNPKA